ncbi:SHIRT domain-containing protein, partial [Streptococcus pneumoniae]
MNFKSRKCEENGKKVLRYSIRKHHLGVASVAVASVLFFATGVATVQADGPGGSTTVTSPSEESTTSGTGSTSGNSTITSATDSTATDQPATENTTATPSGTESTGGNSTPPASGTDRSATSPESGTGETTTKPNYAGTVTLMKQWNVDANDPTIREDIDKTYKTGEDKLGRPLVNSSTANTFLGWSDKPSVNGKIAEGARLFSPEDTLATAFPNGLKPDSKLYGVYTSFTENEEPVPTDSRRNMILFNGLDRFKINANKVKIDTKVESDAVLPNTKLSKATEDENNTRTIIDKYNPENNDTTKVNEVVLKAEFEMDDTTAMTVYRNPDARGAGPVLSNTYKNNKFKIDETTKTYTYVDLNVNLDEDLVVPEKLYAEFNGYSWRPLYALGIKDGKKEILNVYSTSEKNLGNDKNSFNSLVSNTDPKITFGVETKGYNNITFRMILRSLNDKDSNRPEGERNERIAESAIKPDEGKTIAETIMRNMTLKTLSSTELKKLFPGKSDEEINKMVIRIAQDKAKELADSNGKKVLKVTGTVEGNVRPSAGSLFFFTLARNLPINKVAANVLELGYVHPYTAKYKFISGTKDKALPAAIEGYKPTDPKTYENTANVNAIKPTTTEYKVEEEDGKWVFKSYDAENKVVNAANVEFIGTWVFEANKYGVTYKFESGTPGKTLPAAIEGYKPTDQNRYADKANVTPTQPTTKEYVDAENDGKWVFKSYDAENKAVNKADVEFIGTWIFEAKKYGVTYKFESGTPGKTLPEAIEGYKPTDQNRYVDKSNVTTI